MNVVIRYRYRLGDIIRCFPIARHYASAGDKVFIECNVEYHGIFKAISYAKPILPGLNGHNHSIREYDPQIWPNRYNAFRKSGQTWMDFVYGLYPQWQDIDRTIVFDRIEEAKTSRERYGLPEDYSLIFPFSMSSHQVPLPCVFKLAGERMNMENAYLFMSPQQQASMLAYGFEPTRALTVKHLGHLPALIRDAKEVLTVNTATTIIASAVRQRYFHVIEPNQQDNWVSPNQIPLSP